MLQMRTPFFQYITPREWVMVSIRFFERSGNDYPMTWSHVPGKRSSHPQFRADHNCKWNNVGVGFLANYVFPWSLLYLLDCASLP